MATLERSAPITDEQIAELTAGMYYFNIHTEKYPDGEIRGQLMATRQSAVDDILVPTPVAIGRSWRSYLFPQL